MNHDVIVDRYARLYEQPYQLARLGHDVLGVSLSYRPCEAKRETHDAAPGRLRWLGLSPGNSVAVGFAGLLRYPAQALEALREFNPDILVAASDCPHIILGAWLAKRLGICFAADLYDHFESFGLSRIPGIVPLYRRALREADAVTCVSEPLASLVRDGYGASGKVIALPSTINQGLFFARDKEECRLALGLPLDAKLIGTAGGLSSEKGIEPLFRAFEKLADQDSSVHLVLAGKTDPDCPLPENSRVHFLGQLSHADTAILFNALDVGVVYLRDTPYGRYSFPQKAYEMAACRIPIVAAHVGAMATLFSHIEDALYEPDNAASLSGSLTAQLTQGRKADLRIPTWEDQAKEMDRMFARILEVRRCSNE